MHHLYIMTYILNNKILIKIELASTAEIDIHSIIYNAINFLYIYRSFHYFVNDLFSNIIFDILSMYPGFIVFFSIII